MTTLIYEVPDQMPSGLSAFEQDLFANFETHESIQVVLDHLSGYVDDMQGLNVAAPEWRKNLQPGERYLNYTYGFGLLGASIKVTGVLEAENIDFLGASTIGLLLSANKPHASELMNSMGYLTPRQALVPRPPTAERVAELCAYFGDTTNLVVKPAYEESSTGLTLTSNEPAALAASIESVMALVDATVLVQEYIEGTDVAVPVVGRNNVSCMPAVALLHDTARLEPFVFSAELKATKQGVHYAPMADWDHRMRQTIYAMALDAFAVTNQRDYARLDCRVTDNGQVYFLEVNADPLLALGKASFSVSAAAVDQQLGDIVRRMVDDVMPNFGPTPLALGL